MIGSYRGETPRIHPSAFMGDTALVVRDVEIGSEASVWFNVVVRTLFMQARSSREVTDEDVEWILEQAREYLELERHHVAGGLAQTPSTKPRRQPWP